MDLAGYRRVFRDIVEGRTDVLINDDKYYIKHLSALDQVDIDDVKDQYYQNALKRGIPKKQEVLDKLKNKKPLLSNCKKIKHNLY